MQVARVRAGSISVLGALLAALALAAPAGATPSKPYSLVICALGSSETCAPSPASPANAPAAVPVASTSVAMTATFKNENKPGSGIRLGSANLTPPPGFDVTAATLPASCSGCTASVVGNVVQLRGLGLPAGSSLTLSMTVDDSSAAGCLRPNQVPNPTNSPTCASTAEVKQSNDFSGPPGNDLSLDAAASAPYAVLAHLAFGAQPHNELLGRPITDSDYDPSGGPVTVAVVDADGTTVSSYVGPVSLSLNTPENTFTNPNPATLGGTTSKNASAGVASFADLTASAAGNGYTLGASASDLPPSATSIAFNAQQSGATCAENAACPTVEATSDNWTVTDGGVDVKVNSSSGKASELAESIDFGDWTSATRTLECGGASAHFAYQAFTTPRPLTATIITTDLELTQSNFNASVSGQEICLAQSSPFLAKDEATSPPSLIPAPQVTLPDGTVGYAGLEPDCGTKSGQVPQGSSPCVTGRAGTLKKHAQGGTLTITDTSPSDRFVN